MGTIAGNWGRLSILALLLVVACTQEPPPSRQDVLTSLTDQVIVPRFQSVSEGMNGLHAALHGLCSDPTPTNLDTVREAWRDARGAMAALTGDVVRAGDGPPLPHPGGLVAG